MSCSEELFNPRAESGMVYDIKSVLPISEIDGRL